MKTSLIKKAVCLASLGVVLTGLGGSAQAQVATNLFEFDSNADSFLFPSWAGEGTGSFWDNTQDSSGNSASGSQYLYEDNTGGGGQLVGFQCFSLNPYYPYVYSSAAGSNVLDYIDLSSYTNISMDIKWDTTYSTMGINDYNDEATANPPGNGTYGLEIDIIDSASQNFNYVGTIQIPLAASNGWVHVNLALPIGLVDDQAVGVSFKKYTAGGTGVAAFWVDNIQAEAPGTPPPPPVLSPLTTATQGYNIYDDGSAYDRQDIGTLVTNSSTNYSWVGVSTPVSYSFTVAEFPTTSSYESHLFLVPGMNLPTYEAAPDYNESDAFILYANRQGNGTVLGQLRYKVNDPNDNSNLFGSNASVYGGNGAAFTNTIVAGYGGLLGSITNTGSALGTWTVTFNQTTNITVTSPDGHTASMYFPSLSDAQDFAGPLTVLWGTQPNSAGPSQDTVLSSVAISGAPSVLNADLTQPLDGTTLQVVASNGTELFSTPAGSQYWIQWTLPDAGFKLESGASLNGSTWTTNSPPLYIINGKRSAFVTSSMLPAGNSAFLRLIK